VLTAVTVLTQAELAEFFILAGLLVLVARARPRGMVLLGILAAAALGLGAILSLLVVWLSGRWAKGRALSPGESGIVAVLDGLSILVWRLPSVGLEGCLAGPGALDVELVLAQDGPHGAHDRRLIVYDQDALRQRCPSSSFSAGPHAGRPAPSGQPPRSAAG
jgi:hypothetical protein